MRSTWIPSRGLVTFAGRTALAAALGLLCAILAGLHEPHWAAWTVVSLALPARGDSLLKSLDRALGTAVGAPVGVLVVLVAHGNAPLLVGLLAVWLAACVYAGASLRNYRAYGAVLAGYSAVIIAMSLSGDSAQLFEVGKDRCVGVLVGITCGLLVIDFSRESVHGGLAVRRIRHAISAACAWSADRLAGLPRPRAIDGTGPQRLRRQLSDILALDGAVLSAAAESPALWTRTGSLRGVVSALLSLLVVSRGIERNFEAAASQGNAISDEIGEIVVEASVLLRSIAHQLRGDSATECEKTAVFFAQLRALRATLSSARAKTVIERRRIDLVSALLGAAEGALRVSARLTGDDESRDALAESYPAPVYTRDRTYAVAAALRAAIALLLAGTVWMNTGWQGGPLFVAFTAIAIALFSIRPNPRHTAVHFLASGAVGMGAALVFCVTVAPHIAHPAGIVLAEGGIVFLAIVLSSLLSNRFWASGFCLVFLVVADPAAIAHTTASVVSGNATGVLAGSALAAFAFHLAPSPGFESRRGKRRLVGIADTIGTLIASPLGRRTAITHHEWQSRSIDALVRIALPAASAEEVDECMSWIEIGSELLELKNGLRIAAGALSPTTQKALDQLLSDLRDIEPHAWHARLIAADAELHQTWHADQTVLAIRARIAEIASLLKHVTAAGIAPAQ
ncbi:FUSC family protein [Paraburkholderia sp. CNPSo 3157]|uniref:FUSC family protein n=1 Tax=Paraburkholderia franconis TaxID=2654983 RepID=A0A7X1TIN6_9BURK|nr:FUSC family protein [Paraburkholderia franconis]MPW20655.1 FUSC family protein [Paraburkholderia franconis]